MPAPPRNSLAAILAAHNKSLNSTNEQKRTQKSKQDDSATSSRSPTPSQGAVAPRAASSGVASVPHAHGSQLHSAREPPSSSSLTSKFSSKASPVTSASSATLSPAPKASTLSPPSNLPIHADQILTTSNGKQINVCQYNTTGEYILTGGVDRTIRLWNPETKFCIKEYQNHGWEVLDIAVSPENGKFASCGGDKQVYLWDVMSGTTIKRFSGHTQRVNTVDFNSEGTVLASGSYDTSIRLWDCRSHLRAPIQVLEEAKDSVTSIRISGSDILAGCVDGTIRIYDIRMGTLVTDHIFEPVTSVCFSADGNCVLASSLDNTIRLMDRSNGGLLNAYKGHRNDQYKIRSCLSNTDAHVISGSEDGRIFFWDLVEGQVVHQMEAHSKIVSSIAYHPKADRMCSASVDGSIRTWSAIPSPA
ncbi:WD repeat-containing protein 83 [Actinomortierella wolfii]|nr:WD repeat-containing protein 83 [Actinomortierella wolfii]